MQFSWKSGRKTEIVCSRTIQVDKEWWRQCYWKTGAFTINFRRAINLWWNRFMNPWILHYLFIHEVSLNYLVMDNLLYQYFLNQMFKSKFVNQHKYLI